jgi:hypothetical protein
MQERDIVKAWTFRIHHSIDVTRTIFVIQNPHFGLFGLIFECLVECLSSFEDSRNTTAALLEQDG